MSFIKNLFCDEKKGESAVLVDISADSVAGAYAHRKEGEAPVLIYSRRLPIMARTDEPSERAMLRALAILGDDLIREGAPALLRATGSGSAGIVLVSVDTPWQETSVRTENFERESPFVFTEDMVAMTLEKTRVIPVGKILADESIIGATLNGYETRNPYGKKARRASVAVLTSCIDAGISEAITAALQSAYHTKNILHIAGSSLRYQAMRAAFPHERDALILDATGPLISIALVRQGLFVALSEVASTAPHCSRIDIITGELADLAKHYPLPRTIFLLARESEVATLRETLGTVHFSTLWLSDNPPTIVPVLASHLVGLVQQATAAPPDLQLLLMALFYQHRTAGKKG